MQSSSWMTSCNTTEFNRNASHLWTNGELRKRKFADSDSDDESQHKRFVREEKVIKDLQALSLDFSTRSSDQESADSAKDTTIADDNQRRTRIKLHPVLHDHIRNDDLQDALIHRLYNSECKKLFMQIVPYMPIHPAQLHSTSTAVAMEDQHEDNLSPVLAPQTEPNDDDQIFKRPLPPTMYIVEEPCDTSVKRTSPMKRSYSQSLRSNSNLSVVELKNDGNDYSFDYSKDEYFIVEPTTPCHLENRSHSIVSLLPRGLVESSADECCSSSKASSIKITEVFEFLPTTTAHQSYTFDDVVDDDRIDTHSLMSSDTNEQMEEEEKNAE